MKPCSRLGIDLSWRCNVKCKTCFYKYNENFNQKIDKPFENVKAEIDHAVNCGCDHVVAVGQGETTLYPHILDMVAYCKEKGITSSIISNGTTGTKKVDQLFYRGLDHLHLSTHGIDDVLDNILGADCAYGKQIELLNWIKTMNYKWRSNTTLQKDNYKSLLSIAKQNVVYGVSHFVLLGFLPHYEWSQPNKLQEVAVHPKELQPYIEEAIDYLVDHGVYVTLRYHPMCHLQPKYWKYVTNALYVVYDPWEWCYNGIYPNNTAEEMRANAQDVGDTVSIKTEPCISCDLYQHCGGWNKTYADGYNGADLHSIKDDSVGEFGSIFLQNPANNLKGYFG
jgi:MoaA/NifB/PqqE/SkfB family radical SAM enzyme